MSIKTKEAYRLNNKNRSISTPRKAMIRMSSLRLKVSQIKKLLKRLQRLNLLDNKTVDYHKTRTICNNQLSDSSKVTIYRTSYHIRAFS